MFWSEKSLGGAELCMSKMCKRGGGWRCQWRRCGSQVGSKWRHAGGSSYLGDVIDCEAGVQRAVHARVTAAWRRW